jgi:hypothetical protein
MDISFKSSKLIDFLFNNYPSLSIQSNKFKLARIFTNYVKELSDVDDSYLFSESYDKPKKIEPILIGSAHLKYSTFSGTCKECIIQGWDVVSANKKVALESFFYAMFVYLRDDEIISYDHMGLSNWLLCDDVGASSLHLVTFLSKDLPTKNGGYYPLDKSDFSRCIKAIRAIPDVAFRLGNMKNHVDERWVKFAFLLDDIKTSMSPSKEVASSALEK